MGDVKMITIESLIRTASGMASGVIAVAAAHDEEVLARQNERISQMPYWWEM